MTKFKTVDAYWNTLEQTGWLESAAQSQVSALRGQVEESYRHDPSQAWTALASVVFDAECIYESADYLELFGQFTKGSFQLFSPTQVDVIEEEGEYLIEFTLGSNAYQHIASMDSDYFDESIVDLFNEALSSQGILDQFLMLPLTDQVCHYAFCKPETYQNAIQHSLIPS